MQTTAKALRFHVKELLETVARGEEVVITYRGEAAAKLVPIKKTTHQETELFGIWKDNPEVESVEHYVRTLRKNRLDAD